jgi:hypothetical protein
MVPQCKRDAEAAPRLKQLRLKTNPEISCGSVCTLVVQKLLNMFDVPVYRPSALPAPSLRNQIRETIEARGG